MTTSDFEVRPCRVEDLPAILALQERTFGVVRPGHYWHWRVHENPAGRFEACGAFDARGDCVAVSAGITMGFWIDGRDVHAMDHNDVIVDPRLRHGLAGGAIALRTTRRMLEEFIGPTTVLNWGFPSPPLSRLLLQRLGYVLLSDLVVLWRPVNAVDIDALVGSRAVRVEAVERFGADADRLWIERRRELRAAIRRDSTYLNWRFATNPMIDYGLLEARDLECRSLRGLAVVRRGGLDESVLTIVDWVVMRDDEDATRALLARCADEAQRRGLQGLACYFSPASPEFARFEGHHGFRRRAMPHQQVYRSWHPALDRAWLSASWSQTAGDIDFV